jgi:hypothetical protein
MELAREWVAAGCDDEVIWSSAELAYHLRLAERRPDDPTWEQDAQRMLNELVPWVRTNSLLFKNSTL